MESDDQEHGVEFVGMPRPVLGWTWARSPLLSIGLTRAHFGPDDGLFLEIGVTPNQRWNRDQWTDVIGDV